MRLVYSVNSVFEFVLYIGAWGLSVCRNEIHLGLKDKSSRFSCEYQMNLDTSWSHWSEIWWMKSLSYIGYSSLRRKLMTVLGRRQNSTYSGEKMLLKLGYWAARPSSQFCSNANKHTYLYLLNRYLEQIVVS